MRTSNMFLQALKGVFTALVGVVVIAGCAQLPQASAIKQGPNVQSGLQDDYLYYSPTGPVAGQTKNAVLSGFLNAATGPQNDYAVARQYLTPNFKTVWSPNDDVLIQQGASDTAMEPGNMATISVGISAEVDINGEYKTLPSGTKRVLNFQFQKVAGQWRISAAPNAVLLIRPVFDVIFQSYSVYYFDHSYNYLVPDLRWFPSRASTATRMVTAILSGPSAWLAKATQPAMPLGTKLAIDAVTVDGDTAMVNLATSALQTSQSQRQYFKAELLATLSQLPGVSKVQILIDRAEQKVADYSPLTAKDSGYAPVVLANSVLSQLASPAGTQISGSRDLIRQTNATDFAVTSDKNLLALKGPKGIYRVRLDQATQSPVLVDGRKGLLKPIFDSRGILWTMPADGSLAIQTMPESGEGVWQTVSWLSKYQILDYSLSNEGARMAFVVKNSKGQTKILVAAVVRNQLGIPISFGQPLVVSQQANAVSVAWSGETGLLALFNDSLGDSSVVGLALGQSQKDFGAFNLGTQLLSADGGTNIYAVTSDHSLLQYRGYAWTVLSAGVIAAHIPN